MTYNVFCTYRLIFSMVGVCFSVCIMAQEGNVSSYRPEWGCEATSELQVTQDGDWNFANLLRLNASMGVGNSLLLEVGSLSTYMTAEESIGGDLQTFSNMDAGNLPFALSLLDLGWHINERQTLFFGVRNMNEDYFVSDVTSFFTNSSCGIYPTLSANYSIANYPMASVGVHYSYTVERWAFQASLYNGQGYNHFTGRDNVFRFCPKSDGVFGLVQVEHTNNGSRYFLGNAIHGRGGVALTPWFYTEQSINDNIALIAGCSRAIGKDVECRDFVGVGAHFKLRRSEWGVFSDYSRFAEAKEFATEVTCTVPIGEYLYLQPVAHVIKTGDRWSSAYCVRVGVQL